jgi:hypothetical protein
MMLLTEKFWISKFKFIMHYNGYSRGERRRRFRALRQKRKVLFDAKNKGPCEICGDQKGPFDYHSEDCSWPYQRSEYCLCRVCHLHKLHRRFANPISWKVFCAHVRRGGYGRETSLPAFKSELKSHQKILQSGFIPEPLELIPDRLPKKQRWWEGLTCDREVLARFDSRPRADADILRALKAALDNLNKIHFQMIKAHYQSTNQACTITELVKMTKVKNLAASGVAYQNAGKIICNCSEYEPPKTSNGSYDWLTIIAHRNPIYEGRGTQWIMNESFKRAVQKLELV